MSRPHILVVEDESRIATLISKYLTTEGYQFTWLADGSEALSWIKQHQPSLCILDIMLPGTPGNDICQQVRQFSDLPIIMLTAKISEDDRLQGFHHGADDYVCKPFSPKELMARVAALLKRTHPELRKKSELQFGDIQLNEEKYAVLLNQQDVKLTLNEFNILKTLMQDPDKVFSRKELLLAVKHHELEIYERTIDSHIKNLRKKLAKAANGYQYITSVYGVGYSLKNDNLGVN